MRSDHDPVDVKGADGVPAQPLRAPSVEELSVLVALNDCTELLPLFPASGALQHEIGQLGPAGSTEKGFLHREHTRFLQEVEKINKKMTIIFEEGIEAVLTLPNLCSRTERLQPGRQVGSGIRVHARGGPGGKGGREKKGVKEPGVLKPKGGGAGDGGRGGDEEGNVIGCGARERREGGVRQNKVPALIKEDTIDPSEDWGGALVRPSEEAVQERQFEKGKGADGIVKRGREIEVEDTIVFVLRIADEIKVTSDYPGASEQGTEALKFHEERRSKGVIGGGINVCDDEGETRGRGG
jgi:hypothetical protein